MVSREVGVYSQEGGEMTQFGISERDKARALRFAVIKNLVDQKILTIEDGKELLRGNLSPDDPSTYCDDSDLLSE